MKGYYDRPCDCGSGELRYPLNDAAGIFCTYVCDKCEKAVMAKYNPAIFEDGPYAASSAEEDLLVDHNKRWPDDYPAERKIADRIDGYDRDDLGESPDY